MKEIISSLGVLFVMALSFYVGYLYYDYTNKPNKSEEYVTEAEKEQKYDPIVFEVDSYSHETSNRVDIIDIRSRAGVQCVVLNDRSISCNWDLWNKTVDLGLQEDLPSGE